MTAEHVLWPVVREHLGSAAFLWSRWLEERRAPDFRLQDLAGRERRLLAHLDALVVGGLPVQEQLLLPAVEGSDAELAFAAACSLLLSEVGDRSGAVLEHLLAASPGALRGIAGALELAAPAELEPQLRAVQEREQPTLQALATEILSCRRLGLSPELASLSGHEDAQLLAAVARAARCPAGEVYLPVLRQALASAEAAVRDAAIESACIRGSSSVWQLCRQLVAGRAVALRLPLTLLALAGDAREAALIVECLEAEALRPDALWALGFVGTAEAADLCLALMREAILPRQSAEAFCFITGLDLHLEGFAAARRTGVAVADRWLPERWLPEPDVDQVTAWWRANRGGFAPAVRHLLGRPLSRESFVAALEAASMQRRQALLLEAAIRTRGECLVEPRALTRMQRRQQEYLGRDEAASAFAAARRLCPSATG